VIAAKDTKLTYLLTYLLSTKFTKRLVLKHKTETSVGVMPRATSLYLVDRRDCSETYHSYSSCWWASLETFSRSEGESQGQTNGGGIQWDSVASRRACAMITCGLIQRNAADDSDENKPATA